MSDPAIGAGPLGADASGCNQGQAQQEHAGAFQAGQQWWVPVLPPAEVPLFPGDRQPQLHPSQLVSWIRFPADDEGDRRRRGGGGGDDGAAAAAGGGGGAGQPPEWLASRPANCLLSVLHLLMDAEGLIPEVGTLCVVDEALPGQDFPREDRNQLEGAAEDLEDPVGLDSGEEGDEGDEGGEGGGEDDDLEVDSDESFSEGQRESDRVWGVDSGDERGSERSDGVQGGDGWSNAEPPQPGEDQDGGAVGGLLREDDDPPPPPRLEEAIRGAGGDERAPEPPPPPAPAVEDALIWALEILNQVELPAAMRRFILGRIRRRHRPNFLWSEMPARLRDISLQVSGRRRCQIRDFRLAGDFEGGRPPEPAVVDNLQIKWSTLARQQLQRCTPEHRCWLEALVEIRPDTECWSVPATLCAGPHLPGPLNHLSRDWPAAADLDAEAPAPAEAHPAPPHPGEAWPWFDHPFRPLTSLPYFLLKQRDCRWLMYHITSRMALIWGDRARLGQLPRHPLPFSYQAARLALVEPPDALELLRLDSVWERLRRIYRSLTNLDLVVCRRCDSVLAHLQNAITMAAAGGSVLKTFVNPHGVNHDVLTVSHLRAIGPGGEPPVVLVGRPSTQASWFPGYAWTIAVCGECHNHAGWRFTAVPAAGDRGGGASVATEPPEFWGLSRAGIMVVAARPEPAEQIPGR